MYILISDSTYFDKNNFTLIKLLSNHCNNSYFQDIFAKSLLFDLFKERVKIEDIISVSIKNLTSLNNDHHYVYLLIHYSIWKKKWSNWNYW